MDAIKARDLYLKSKKVYDSALLTFCGAEGLDVYNCSIPFEWQGKTYIFGRVERREDFANSFSCLFEKTGEDDYTAVPGAMIYPLEDPFIQVIHGELIMGGTHVKKCRGEIDTFYGYFYRGLDLNFLTHFTAGPANMKDIRLLELADGRVGVFSRPRNDQVLKKYGSGAVIGFTVIDSVDALDAEAVENAQVIKDLFGKGEWGGCNQCYLLKDGRIGVIGHRSYEAVDSKGQLQQVYMNISFVFDPMTHRASDMKVIGDKPSYPATGAMRPDLEDCAFTSGIVLRKDGRADLYSGLCDVAQGRIVIDNPFEGLL